MRAGVLWTNLSLRDLSRRLVTLGTPASRRTIRRLLRKLKIGRRTARKKKTMGHHPDLRCGKVDRGSLECLKPTRPCPMLSSSIEEVGDGEHQVVGTSWGGGSSGHRVGRTRPYRDG